MADGLRDGVPPRTGRLDPRRGLPRHPFLYTEDQVAAMLSLSVDSLRKSYLFREGIDTGIYRPRWLRSVNIAAGRKPAEDETRAGRPPAEWRVSEPELIRWLRYHKLWIYDPTDPAMTDTLEQPFKNLRRTSDDDRLFS